MNIFIAIDDTDNHESRGTGFLARRLAEKLENYDLAKITGVTRHQLLVDDRIPYTSHNSAACITAGAEKIEEIIYICRTFLRSESAAGSDAGLCVASEELVSEDIVNWGLKAKKEVLTMDAAFKLAKNTNVFLEGFCGTHGGVIGAMAAVGLRKTGNDGRFLWVRGMRKYMGVMNTREILEETGVEVILGKDGIPLMNGSRILLPEWWRPVLKNNKAVLMVEPNTETEFYEYKVISKDDIKRITA